MFRTRRQLLVLLGVGSVTLSLATGGVSWASSPPTNTSAPTVSGVAKVGQTLTASPGTWSGTAPITYGYTWQRCMTTGTICASIAGASSSTYLLTPTDVGAAIRVGVTASDSGGTSAPAYSGITAPVAPLSSSSSDPFIGAAGDIACDPSDPNYNGGSGTAGHCNQKATSNLLVNLGLTAVLPLGDEQYDCGALSEFQTSYGPTWGRTNGMTYPVPGNHEYISTNPDAFGDSDCSSNAKGYYSYFGAAAGSSTGGYYSFNIGAWHLIALNTNRGCAVVACGPGSAQEVWLRNDLSAHANQCILAYWHAPVFSSKVASTAATTLFSDLYKAHADVVLNGHAHNYERFAPLAPDGTYDPVSGLREFVVGTGGEGHQKFGTTILATSEARSDTNFGVLRLQLHASGYDWKFVPSGSSTFTDSGSGTCHNTTTQAATAAPSVSTGAASNVTDSTATVSGTVNPNGLTTSYRFDYGTTTTYTTSTVAGSISASTNATAVAASVSGLLPNTTYHYRVEATNADGTTFGSDATFTTSSTTGTCTPGSVVAADVEDTFTTSSYPTSQHGGDQTLKADTTSTTVRNTWIKFNTAGLVPAGCQVTAVAMTLDPTGSWSSQAMNVYAADPGTWTESTLTWDTQPPQGSLLSSVSGVTLTAGTPTTIALPVDTWLNTSGLSSVEITSATSAAKNFESKEYAGTLSYAPPVITLTFG